MSKPKPKDLETEAPKEAAEADPVDIASLDKPTDEPSADTEAKTEEPKDAPKEAVKLTETGTPAFDLDKLPKVETK